MSLGTLAKADRDGGLDNGNGSGNGGLTQIAIRTTRKKAPLKEESMLEKRPVLLDKMETPTVVRQLLDRLPELTVLQQKDYEREFKLSYYFEGLCVALMMTSSGPEIFASGSEKEVATVLKTIPKEKVAQLTLIDPEPLKAVAAQLSKRSTLRRG